MAQTRMSAVLVLLVSLLSFVARGGDLRDPLSFTVFTAQLELSSEVRHMTGNYFRDGFKMRIEPTTMVKNGKTHSVSGLAIIRDLSANTQTMLNSQQKIFVEVKPGSFMAKQAPSAVTLVDMVRITSRKVLGREDVAGHPTQLEAMSAVDKDGKEWSARVWLASDLQGFPIRTELTDAKGKVSTITFSNIQFIKPGGDLFVVPAGYKAKAATTPPPGNDR